MGLFILWSMFALWSIKGEPMDSQLKVFLPLLAQQEYFCLIFFLFLQQCRKRTIKTDYNSAVNGALSLNITVAALKFKTSCDV